jgi:hypothetical protein
MGWLGSEFSRFPATVMQGLEEARPTVQRWLRRVALSLAAGVVSVALLWLVFNLRDARPQPRPPLLVAGGGPPGLPLFYALQGVPFPSQGEPEAAGRALWAQLHQPGGLQAVERWPRLPRVVGRPLQCRVAQDCAVALVADTEARPADIEAQLAPVAALGERCVAALADARYLEALAPRLDARTLLPSALPAAQCNLWFKGQALLATLQDDRESALRRLAQGQLLATATLSGSRMLTSTLAGVQLVAEQWQAVAAVAALQPAWAAELRPLAAALPARALDLRRWAVTESTMVNATAAELFERCARGEALDVGIGVLPRWLPHACRFRVGLLREATLQALDARWAALLERLSRPSDEPLDALLSPRLAVRELSQPAPPAWRNTLGQMLLARLQPDLEPALLRLADLELHRQVLALALAAQAQRVALPSRAAWLAQQPLPARLKGRIGWSDGGTVLQGQPWSAERGGDPVHAAPVRVPVPAPPAS